MDFDKFRKLASRCILVTALSCGTLAVSSCAILTTTSAITSLFKIKKTSKRIKRAKKIVTMIGSVLGAYAKTTNHKALVGTWTYVMPAIQFDNEKNLNEAGGVLACQNLTDEITPVLEKIGLEFGKVQMTLKEDNSAVYSVAGHSLNGSYTFDEATGKLVLRLGPIALPAAYLSVEDSQMAMTFDASRIAGVAKVAGLVNGVDANSVMGLSKLTESHDGMKAGLAFLKTE